jgi:oligopeptide transport system permease protein
MRTAVAGYVFKRFAASVFTIFVVITLTFFLMRLMPGSPFLSERISQTALENMNTKYGLDKPILEQYGLYLSNIVHGDFGVSMLRKGREVTGDIILKFFPNSARIGSVSVIVSAVFGLLLGLWAGMNQGKWQDKFSTFIATIGMTIPMFVIGSVLLYFFAVKNPIFPPNGFKAGAVAFYVLPVISLAGQGMAAITRLLRTKYIEVRNSDYMRTARAKGLGAGAVVLRHGLRNAIIPVVTYLGPLVAAVLTGSFVVERLFGIPGLGQEFVQAVTGRDYSVVMGLVVFYCSFIILCNFIVDVLYVVIDPRIKLDEA